jgi:hypothetical protein
VPEDCPYVVGDGVCSDTPPRVGPPPDYHKHAHLEGV